MARLAVTMGDPAGIGPEVLANTLPGLTSSEVLLIGDRTVWRRALAAVGASGVNKEAIIRAGYPIRDEYELCATLYHDQAQIATKLLGFERSVSVGVGYPFVLTTPSHGTAFDIAGQGVADSGPMRQALALAGRLVAERIQSGSAQDAPPG